MREFDICLSFMSSSRLIVAAGGHRSRQLRRAAVEVRVALIMQRWTNPN